MPSGLDRSLSQLRDFYNGVRLLEQSYYFAIDTACTKIAITTKELIKFTIGITFSYKERRPSYIPV